MGQYDGKDMTFEVPDGWNDRTVVAFTPAQRGNKVSPSFVVTRESLKDGESLRTFASRQLTELAKGLKHFNLRENREVTFDTVTAPQYEFTWVSPNGPLFQQMTFAQHGKGVVLFTGSCPQNEANKLRPTFDKMLQSVKLREAAPEEQAAPAAPSAAPSAPASTNGNGPQSPGAPRQELPPDWWPGAKRR